MTPTLYAMAGPALVLGISLFGSSLGCAIGFSAAQGVMARTDEGHAKYISKKKISKLSPNTKESLLKGSTP